MSENLSLELDDFTNTEMDDFCGFIQMDNLAIKRLLRVYFTKRDAKFENAEAIVLFDDEILIRVKGKGQQKVWNEKLGIPLTEEVDSDWEVSIPRRNLIAIGVFKQHPCDCEVCKTKDDTEIHKAGYRLDFVTCGNMLSFAVDNKEEAFNLKEAITFWLSDKAKWKTQRKKK